MSASTSQGQDPVMDRIGEAIEMVRSGDREAARERFAQLWDELGPTGDAFHRCVLAHFAADVEPDLHDELGWDLAALAAADDVSDERAQTYHPSLRVAGFYPSLHGSLAEDYRKLGDLDRAREHLAKAQACLPALADDAYGQNIRSLIERISADLDDV